MIRKPITRKKQNGSVLVNVAAGLSLMVALLASIDLGMLYFYKREYQKAADLAAMAGARQLVVSCAAAETVGIESANLNLAQHEHDSPVAQCGRWEPDANPRFVVGITNANAIRVLVLGTVPTFFLGSRNLSADAIAIGLEPLAQLQIRSSVATVNGGLLNDVAGALLGGSVNLSAVAWQGLLDTSISLLEFSEALALRLGVEVGDMDQLLSADATLSDLLDASIDVLQQGGGTGNIAAGLLGVESLAALNLPAYDPLLQLGDLLTVQSGTELAGLDSNLNLFGLVQASIQAASAACTVCATVPINLPGLLGVQISTRIIEPPQLTAVGRPRLAKADPLGPDRIFVRTAQVRSLVSVELPVAGSVLTLLQTIINDVPLINSITNVVNDLLALNLVGILNSLLGTTERDVLDLRVLPTPRIDVNVDVGEGQAYVEDFSCEGGKSLDVPTRTAAANIRIGKMGNSNAEAIANVFSSNSAPTVEPIPVVDIGSYRARQTCLLLICSTTWRRADGTWTSNKALAQRFAFSGGGIGIRAQNVPVGGTNTTKFFDSPPAANLPDLGEPPAWQDVSSTQIVNGLSDAISGLQIQVYPPTLSGSGLGGLVALVGGVANTLLSTLQGLINSTLGPLLDPIVDFLTDALGIDVNQVEVGANLSCAGGGGSLVE